MDSVEIANCSQRSTFNAAIRIENAMTLHQQITNSAIHGSRAWGLSLLNSKNIFVQNTHVIGARAMGIVVQSSNNVTLDYAIVAHVERRVELEMVHVMDVEGCFSLCTMMGQTSCDLQVTNSIAAGCPWAGFVVPGHDCDDDEDTSFINNVAHSTESVGILMAPPSSDNGCIENAHNAAYKTGRQSFGFAYKATEARFRDVTAIDSHIGLTIIP